MGYMSLVRPAVPRTSKASTGPATLTTSQTSFVTAPSRQSVPVDGGSRQVALYAIEAPENWFEDFGSGRLSNGEAVIHLDPVFAQTVNTGMDYHVFPVPNGDCKGLYVAEKTASGFVVRELGAGKSNIAFDYRIVARRKGYENIRLADKTKEFTENKLKRQAQMREEQERMMARPVAAISSPQHH